jgi:hypothetical protein
MDLSDLGAVALGTCVISLFAFLGSWFLGRSYDWRDRLLDGLAVGAIAAGGVLVVLLVGRALFLVVQGLLRSFTWG